MNPLGRASLVFVSSVASIALSGCAVESAADQVTDEVSEEGELGAAQSALCDIGSLVPHASGSIRAFESFSSQSPSGAYGSSNCSGSYVVEVTNTGLAGPWFDLVVHVAWENGITSEFACETAHVYAWVYGYNPSSGQWIHMAGGSTATGEWDDTNGCEVSVSHLANHAGVYSKYRVMARAWHDHPGGPSVHPVTMEMSAELH